jgi:hypothetical protein
VLAMDDKTLDRLIEKIKLAGNDESVEKLPKLKNFMEYADSKKIFNFKCQTGMFAYINYPILTSNSDFSKYNLIDFKLQSFPTYVEKYKNSSALSKEIARDFFNQYLLAFEQASLLNITHVYAD